MISMDNEYFLDSEYHVVDLRSDTVSKPTQKMRQAMFDAEVGDDVYLEDPTINRLEKLSAEIFSKERALFVPSGTMGNLIATHCDRRGCEVIMGDQSHTFLFEQGGASQIGGVSCFPLPNSDDGTFSLALAEQAIRANDIHSPITGLIIAENTHNMCGGKVLPMEWLHKLAELARTHRVPLHMDGARIFNAAAYLKVPVSKITDKFDSVQFCFSKGLGAPVGSMLVGSKAFIEKARRLRKVLGGGMRQAGVLGAACLEALNSMIGRLDEDHRRTKELARAIAGLNCNSIRVDVNNLHTNILMIYFDPKVLKAHDFCRRLAMVTEHEKKELGDKCVIVRFFAKTDSIARMVFYYEIGDEDVSKLILKLNYVVKEMKEKGKLV